MPDDVNSSGAINIRPEISSSAQNQSDSRADNSVVQDLSNRFAAQTLEVQGVSAGASFAPVALTVAPNIRGSGGVAATIRENTGLVAVLGATVVVAALIWYTRRKGVRF